VDRLEKRKERRFSQERVLWPSPLRVFRRGTSAATHVRGAAAVQRPSVATPADAHTYRRL